MSESVVFNTPGWFAAAASLIAAAAAILLVGRVRSSRSATACLAAGALLIATAAGSPAWRSPAVGTVAVMVDLSPSTRGALFRSRPALLERVHQLLGKTPFTLHAFSADTRPLPDQPTLPDLLTDRTRFTPPSEPAVLLFSDGRFDPPAVCPPVYAVIDPNLIDPPDTRVAAMRWTSRSVLADVYHAGPPRPFRWINATADQPSPVDQSIVLSARPTTPNLVTAIVAPGDLWPENDALSTAPPLPAPAGPWWVGNGPPPDPAWRPLTAALLPSDLTDFLSASLIVLNDIPADTLTDLQQQRLAQYARDLGGCLLVVGGPHSFAAGNYPGSTLQAMLPLRTLPPTPTNRWIILIDGSGSMADADAWPREISAVRGLLPRLSPIDLTRVGSFSDTIHWWTPPTTTAADVLRMSLPPAGVTPSGPTNLRTCLADAVASTGPGVQTQLLLTTDSDADPPDVAEMSAAMLEKKIHLQVLATARGRAFRALVDLATATGGSVVEQSDPARWSAAVNQLLKSARAPGYVDRPTPVHFLLPAQPAGDETVPGINPTWIEPAATPWATASDSPVAAAWSVGLGRVVALGFPATIRSVESIARSVETAPRDPRFGVNVSAGSTVTVLVDAIDDGRFLNGEKISARFGNPPAMLEVPQTGPGRYEASFPSPSVPTQLLIFDGPRIVDRRMLSGHYPAEFDGVGNDLAALANLTERTAGRVIPPGPASPIDFHWPSREIDLSPWVAAMGWALCAAGALRHRNRPAAD